MLKSDGNDGVASSGALTTAQASGADSLISILSKRGVMIGIALAVFVASVVSKFLSFLWQLVFAADAPQKVVEFASSTGDALELFGTALASLLGLILAAKAVKLSEDNERQNSRYQALTSILFDPGYRKWVESKALLARFGSIDAAFDDREKLLKMASSEQMNQAIFSPNPHSCSKSHASSISAARSELQFSQKRLIDFLSTDSLDQDLMHVLFSDVRSASLRFEARMDAAWVDRDGEPVLETDVGIADRLANVAFSRVVEAASCNPLKSIRLDFIPFQSSSTRELVGRLKSSGYNVIAASTTLQGLDSQERERLIESVEEHASAPSPATPAILLVEADGLAVSGIPEGFVRVPVTLKGERRNVDEELLANYLAGLIEDRQLFATRNGDRPPGDSGGMGDVQRHCLRDEFTNAIVCALPYVLQMSDSDEFIARAKKCADEILSNMMNGQSDEEILAMGAEERDAFTEAIAIQARRSLENSRILFEARCAAEDLIRRRVLFVYCGAEEKQSASN